jgi:hypothetical protein
MQIIPKKTWDKYKNTGDEFQITSENTLEIKEWEWDKIYSGYEFDQNKSQCWNLANNNLPAKPVLSFSEYLHELIKLKED